MTRWPTNRFGRSLAVALVAIASMQTAQAGLFDDDEARKRVELVRKSLEDAQAQADTLRANQLDFANQIEALRGELAKLRGQVEVLTYDLETTQKRQQDFYVDLDNRLRKLEAPEPAATAPAASQESATPAVADSDAYEKAVNALKGGKTKEAALAFDAFIAGYPQSKLLGSAHFWGAYARGQGKDYKGAAQLFGKFAEGWPDDPRSPDALESQADNLALAKDTKGAQVVLQRLVDKYPNSEAGKRVKQQLKKK